MTLPKDHDFLTCEHKDIQMAEHIIEKSAYGMINELKGSIKQINNDAMESTQDVKEKVNSIHEKFIKQTDFEEKKWTEILEMKIQWIKLPVESYTLDKVDKA